MAGADYNAFISYSSGATGRLAASLQAWLERFATPWYRPRRLRIYRDYTNLSAGGELKGNLFEALSRSEWFILIASRAAAASPWVNQEVSWWRENRSAHRVILVLADGSLHWDDETNDWDWSRSDALPPAARGMFAAEPLWVDLSLAVTTGRLDRSNPDLLNSVARIAAPLHGVDKDSIVGEHLTTLRRARRQRTGGVIALALLLVLSIVAGTVAVVQARRATEQSRIAMSRALASASAANVDSRLDLALLLAVEAYRMHADHLTWAALFNAAMANPALERFLPADAAVTQVAASAGGAVIAAGTAAGTVSVWRAGTDRTDLARLSGPIRGLSMNDDGRVLAATTETDILVWQEDSEELIRTAPNGHRAYGIAVSPSGRTVVWITVVKDSGSPAELTVLDTTTGAMPTTRVGGTYVYTAVALPSDDEVVLLDEAYGAWQRRRLPDLAPIAAGYEGFGLHNKTSALSPDGSMLTYTNGDDVIPVASTLDDTVELSVASVGPSPSALAISRDLSRVATATAGTIYVADVTDGDRPEPPVSLAGVASVGRGALAFVDDRTRLVGGSADYVVQWNIANLGRIVRGIPGTALNACEACTGPRLTLSPDGRYALLISIGGREMVLRDLETGTEVVWEPGILFYRYPVATWLPGQPHSFMTFDPTTSTFSVFNAQSPFRATSSWVDPSPPEILQALAVSPDGRSVVYVDEENVVAVRDMADGHAIVDIPPPGRPSGSRLQGDPNNGEAAISPNAGRVAIIDKEANVIVVDVAARSATMIAGPARWVQFAGTMLAVSRGDRVDIFDGTELVRSTPSGREFAISNDGAILASLQDDLSIEVRDVMSGEPIGTIPNVDPKASLIFARDNRTLVATAEDGSIRFWALDPMALIESACETAGRSMSAAEWERFTGTTAPADLSCRRRP